MKNHLRSALLALSLLVAAGCAADPYDSLCKVCETNADCPQGLVCASVSCGQNACVFEAETNPGHPNHGEIDRMYECPGDGSIYRDADGDGRLTPGYDPQVFCE